MRNVIINIPVVSGHSVCATTFVANQSHAIVDHGVNLHIWTDPSFSLRYSHSRSHQMRVAKPLD